MTRRLALAAAIAASAAIASAGPQTFSFASEALGGDAAYIAIVPPDVAPNERFPVVYILHGAFGGREDWIANSRVEDIAADYRMILVFPDGGQFGWYVDDPDEPTSRYETFVVEELVPRVDATLPTVSTPSARAIMGLSMGGHGAVTLAAKHWRLFVSASSTSGILDLTAHPTSWQIPDRLGPLAENRARWEANSALHLAETFKTARVRLLLDCGTDDTLDKQTGALEDGRAFHAKLVEFGVPHIWREHPGGHSWAYWDARISEHLDFHQAAMLAHTPNLGPERVEKFKALNAAFKAAEKATVAPPQTPTPTPTPSVP